MERVTVERKLIEGVADWLNMLPLNFGWQEYFKIRPDEQESLNRCREALRLALENKN